MPSYFVKRYKQMETHASLPEDIALTILKERCGDEVTFPVWAMKGGRLCLGRHSCPSQSAAYATRSLQRSTNHLASAPGWYI